MEAEQIRAHNRHDREAEPEAPQHEHDCATCVFLGRYGQQDLYFHQGERPFLTTVIARWGSHGDYSSGLCFADRIPELGEAKRRAIERGLLTAGAAA